VTGCFFPEPGGPFFSTGILSPQEFLPHGRNGLNTCVPDVCYAPESNVPPDIVYANVRHVFEGTKWPVCRNWVGHVIPAYSGLLCTFQFSSNYS